MEKIRFLVTPGNFLNLKTLNAFPGGSVFPGGPEKKSARER
jgi:hypothetical protein